MHFKILKTIATVTSGFLAALEYNIICFWSPLRGL